MNNKSKINFAIIFLLISYINSKQLMGGMQTREIDTCREADKFLKNKYEYLTSFTLVECKIQVVNGIIYLIRYHDAGKKNIEEFKIYEPAVGNGNYGSRFNIMNHENIKITTS